MHDTEVVVCLILAGRLVVGQLRQHIERSESRVTGSPADVLRVDPFRLFLCGELLRRRSVFPVQILLNTRFEKNQDALRQFGDARNESANGHIFQSRRKPVLADAVDGVGRGIVGKSCCCCCRHKVIAGLSSNPFLRSC